MLHDQTRADLFQHLIYGPVYSVETMQDRHNSRVSTIIMKMRRTQEKLRRLEQGEGTRREAN
jgi:hypothetical protein